MNGRLGAYSGTLEGARVTFQCDDGYVPTIVGIATCKTNGRWTPDPVDHVCTLQEGMYVKKCHGMSKDKNVVN